MQNVIKFLFFIGVAVFVFGVVILSTPYFKTASIHVSTNISGATTSSPENILPTADAGKNQIVLSGILVKLDGNASLSPRHAPITFQWIQIGGPTVKLSSSSIVNPEFMAPVVTHQTVLTFLLTVTDNTGLVSPTPGIISVVVNLNFDTSKTKR